MLFKWLIGGAIVGGIAGALVADPILGALAGGIFGVGIRKWILEKLWM